MAVITLTSPRCAEHMQRDGETVVTTGLITARRRSLVNSYRPEPSAPERSWLYTVVGPMQDLISAGVCTEEMFPRNGKRVIRGGDQAAYSHWHVKKAGASSYEFFVCNPREAVRDRCEDLMRVHGIAQAHTEIHPSIAERRQAVSRAKVIGELERLLRHAHLGHIDAFVWAAQASSTAPISGAHGADLVGEAVACPQIGWDLALSLLCKARAFIDGDEAKA